MTRALLLSLILFFSLAGAVGAYCMPYKNMVKYLAENYQERREAVAVLHSGFLYEVFVSITGGFTVVTTNPADRLSCMQFIGKGYYRFAQEPVEEPT